MSLLDFFTGHWTASQLFWELFPLALVGSSAYFVGYQRGLSAGFRRWNVKMRVLERLQALGKYPGDKP